MANYTNDFNSAVLALEAHVSGVKSQIKVNDRNFSLRTIGRWKTIPGTGDYISQTLGDIEQPDRQINLMLSGQNSPKPLSIDFPPPNRDHGNAQIIFGDAEYESLTANPDVTIERVGQRFVIRTIGTGLEIHVPSLREIARRIKQTEGKQFALEVDWPYNP